MIEQSKAPAKAKTFPVIEIFGPTIQGEGPEAGIPCAFVRFGGCDFRCSWCDSLHAVIPAEVRANAEKLTAEKIVERLWDLSPVPPFWIVLSGGNPALHELLDLVRELQLERKRMVSVETQGSVWKRWLAEVDRLVVSPKPPSSGMASLKHREQLDDFMGQVAEHGALSRTILKIVIFDDDDLEWAREIAATERPEVPLYLSVGTPQDLSGNDDFLRIAVANRYKWLCERVIAEPAFHAARVLPQLHVIAWGARLGV